MEVRAEDFGLKEIEIEKSKDTVKMENEEFILNGNRIFSKKYMINYFYENEYKPIFPFRL